MSQMAFFYVMVDVPDDADVNGMETLVAQSVAIAMVNAGTPGNVLASWWKTFPDQSVATFAPNSAQAVPVGSPGTTTMPVSITAASVDLTAQPSLDTQSIGVVTGRQAAAPTNATVSFLASQTNNASNNVS